MNSLLSCLDFSLYFFSYLIYSWVSLHYLVLCSTGLPWVLPLSFPFVGVAIPPVLPASGVRTAGDGCRDGAWEQRWEALKESVMCWARLANMNSAPCDWVNSSETLARTHALQHWNSLGRAGLDVCGLLRTDMPFELAAGAVTARSTWVTAIIAELCCFLRMSIFHIYSSLIIYN